MARRLELNRIYGALPLIAALLGGCDASPVTSDPTRSPAPTGEVTTPQPDATAVRASFVARLTREQYEYIVLDVFDLALNADESNPAAFAIPSEKNSSGLFQNSADGQSAADAYPLALGRLAASLAARIPATALNAVAGCADAVACPAELRSALGLRLFRRPLSGREANAYSELHVQLVAANPDVDAANRGVLEAMLQAPAFVFRTERETEGAAGARRFLDGYELAARLSFFVWNSAPDPQLYALAASDALNGSPEAVPVLQEQLKRMLADPRSRRLTRRFVLDFAETERAGFAGMTAELQQSLIDSLVASFDKHLWDDEKSIAELFTSRELVLNEAAATLISLPVQGDGLEPYDVSGLPGRVGWLTHPGFIAGFGDATDGKIVHRGIALMVKLMCRQPLDVPEALGQTIAEFSADFAMLTERERSDLRREMAAPGAGTGDAACWGCHSQFEPLAYGFDRFDAAGRYLGESNAAGEPRPIDGWLTDDLTLTEEDRPRYNTVSQYMALLATSKVVQACMAEHFVAYAMGRTATPVEKQLSVVINGELKDSNTLHALASAVVSSELFRSLQPVEGGAE